MAETAAGVSTETGRWVLFATVLASSMAFIDGSALNVALPALQRDLGRAGPTCSGSSTAMPCCWRP